MGFDCTLHVIDESSIVRFVDRFLGRSSAKAPYDRKFKQTALAFKSLRALVASDPGPGARELARILLQYCSAETPHVYCRGFALSLWDDAALGASLPKAAFGSVEPLLAELVAAHPALAGELPCGFDGNWSIGYFVTASDVPEVLARVEASFEALAPGERVPYLGLRTVLRVAAKRGMAYWEATDIDVAQANEKWIAAEAPEPNDDVRVTEVAIGGALVRPLAIFGDRLILSDSSSFATHALDLATFPPRAEKIDSLFSMQADFTAAGRLLVNASTNQAETPRTFSLAEIESFAEPPQRLGVELPWKVDGFRCIGEELYVFPSSTVLRTLPEVRPVLVRDGELSTASLPDAQVKRAARGVSFDLVCDALPFGDGAYLVIWDGDGYLYERGVFTSLGIHDLRPEDLGSSARLLGHALGDGSILLLSNRTLLQVHRSGEANPRLQAVDNVMFLVELRDGAVALQQGHNLENDAFKIWWRTSGEVTQVPPSVFGSEGGLDYIVYARGLDLVVAAEGCSLRSIPFATLEALPRRSEADFSASHAKLVAKAAARKA